MGRCSVRCVRALRPRAEADRRAPLVGISGYGLAWTGAALLAVVAAGLALLVGETREQAAPGVAVEHHFVHRPAVPIALGFLASLIAMGGFLAFASIHAVDVGLQNASLALFTYGAVVVTCRIAFARVPDRLPPLALEAGALAVLGAGLVIAATWQTVVGLIVGGAVAAVGIAFTTPAFFSAIFATASPAQRGVASGTASAAIDLGLGIGPIALGLVAESLGIPWAFGIGAAVAGAGALWTLGLRRRTAVSVPGTSRGVG